MRVTWAQLARLGGPQTFTIPALLGVKRPRDAWADFGSDPHVGAAEHIVKGIALRGPFGFHEHTAAIERQIGGLALFER